jgi:hypothetical protein
MLVITPRSARLNPRLDRITGKRLLTTPPSEFSIICKKEIILTVRQRPLGVGVAAASGVAFKVGVFSGVAGVFPTDICVFISSSSLKEILTFVRGLFIRGNFAIIIQM